jgi:hypothetical protein
MIGWPDAQAIRQGFELAPFLKKGGYHPELDITGIL